MRSDNPFGSRKYVAWWLGHLVSTLGTQMSWVAIPYQVYLLSGKDPLALGLVGLARAGPMVAMALAGGVIADSFDRRKVLFVTQSLLCATVACLAMLTANGAATVAHMYAMIGLMGLVVAVDLPARGAMITNLVSREQLPRAIAINISTFQIASLVGPAIGGWVLAKYGPGTVYVVDAISFASVIAALFFVPPNPPGSKTTPTLADAIDGVKFVFSQPVIRTTMVLDFLASFFAEAKFLMPIFAIDILHGDQRTLGWMLAGPPAGAALAALVLGVRGAPRRRGRLVIAGVVVYGLATIGFGLSQSVAAAVFWLACTGVADSISMVMRNTTRHELTPDHMRARMMAVNMMFFIGGPLLGEFEAGVVAKLWSPRAAVVAGGVACVVCAALCAVLVPWLWSYTRDQSPESSGSESGAGAPSSTSRSPR